MQRVDDELVQLMSSSSENGHCQSRPSRLELQQTGTGDGRSGQCVNGGVSLASSAACKSASSTVVTEMSTSQSDITASTAALKDSVKSQCWSELNGDSQTLLSSVATSGVQLPSPPPTPPPANCQSSDSHPSPTRESQDIRKNSTPESVELPPPPSPPLQFSQLSFDSPGGVLPPPPLDDSLYTTPPRVSPPPPMSPVLSMSVAELVNSAPPTSGDVIKVSTFVVEPSAVDGLSVLSDVMCGFEAETHNGRLETLTDDQPLIRDTRCDLLSAIRQGTQRQRCHTHLVWLQ